MHIMHHAAGAPEKPAVIMAGSGKTVSYAELEAQSNQAAQLFRSLGLKRGDTIAIFAENTPTYFALCWGAQRSGLVFTCISSKLSADEVEYIVRDCGARAFFASASLGGIASEVARRLGDALAAFAVDGDIPGFRSFAAESSAVPASRIADESSGRDMLYSSGTTGRPKGIKGMLPEEAIDAPNVMIGLMQALFGFNDQVVYLSPAPLYHAAPLRYCMGVQKLGGTVVVMEHFDPEQALAAIEKYRITHSQWVPTHFVRMLKLPEEVRRRYDVSSLKVAIHAAAPCPVEIKEQMFDWWGDVIYEYYSATEGAGFTAIGPADWKAHRGSVGRSMLGQIHILDEDGEELPPGEIGRVYFSGGPPFEYHGDAEQARGSLDERGRATFGDIGYVDTDGFLYLTDRQAFMIISGGVNIYPQEVENVLVAHPKVADVAVFGVPNPEFGEEVKAVVQPMDWADAGPDLAAELIAYCRDRLSHVKCPRTVDFEPELPRHPTGKLYKRLLKDRYWGKGETGIV